MSLIVDYINVNDVALFSVLRFDILSACKFCVDLLLVDVYLELFVYQCAACAAFPRCWQPKYYLDVR